MDSSQFNSSSFTGGGSQPQPNSFSASGAFVPPSFQGSMFQDDTFAYASGDGQDYMDPKRRRIARACDMCRKKKIKCDGKLPACSHCQNYNTECVFTHVEKKRSPPKGAKYIEGLENRLGRMESLLRLSGLLGEEEGETDLRTLEQKLARRSNSHNGSPSNTSDREECRQSPLQEEPQDDSPRNVHIPTPNSNADSSPRSSKAKGKVKADEESGIANLSDMMSCLVTNSDGETRYIGSSSGFSIFSPKGIEWVNTKTGDSTFQDMIQKVSIDDNKWHPWRPEIFGDIFARRVFKSLPSREDCMSLLKDFFLSFNMMFPLFHEPTFMHLVDKQYSDEPYDGSGWWASLNVALAIGYRIRIMNNQIHGKEESVAWGYFKNALAVLSELTLRNSDLFSVQALLGMALFLQGTPNPQPSFFLVSAAVRLSHSLGLHKRGSSFGLNEIEAEQRKRVFWIAYLLDKDISLRSGRPPIQDDDDWNVELPSEDAHDDVGNIPLADGKGKTNLFRLLCRFAMIESKVYKKLYSVKASRQSDGELLNTIGDLDNELEQWKDSIPLDFRPEHEINASHSPLMFQVVVLHFAYYNCLTTIHRMSIHHGYWSDKLSEYAIQGLNLKPLNPRVFSSAALCVAAARASIQLIRYIPPGDYSCVWLILYYPVSALITIFANILQNPHDVRARSDLKLMEVVVDFLSRIYHEESTGSMKRMFTVCSEFKRIAGVVLDKAEQDMNTRQRRKHEREREKLERPGEEHQKLTKQQQKQREALNQAAPQAQPHDAMLQPTVEAYDPSGSNASTTKANVMPPNTFGLNDLPDSAGNNQFPVGSHAGAEWVPGMAQDEVSAGTFQQGGIQPGFNFNFNPLSLADENMGVGTSTGLREPSMNNMGAFQQPFLPQDLWSMPMTFEWDWADMSMPVFQDTGPQQPQDQEPHQ